MLPSATYNSPDSTTSTTLTSSSFTTLRSHKTYNETDRDVATEPKETPLGDLRRGVVDLQGKINEFLTAKLDKK